MIRNTSTPSLISFQRIQEMLTTPAEATETNGTSLARRDFVVGVKGNRGTARVRETAMRTEVAVAAR